MTVKWYLEFFSLGTKFDLLNQIQLMVRYIPPMLQYILILSSEWCEEGKILSISCGFPI